MKSRKLRRFKLELDSVKACGMDTDGCILCDGICEGSDSSCAFYDGDCGLIDHGCIYHDECGEYQDTQGCAFSSDFKRVLQTN